MSGLDPNAGGALVVPGGGTSLPTATGAGQILRSTGAGAGYAAVDQGDVVGDALDSIGPSGLRAALDVYSKAEVDARAGGYSVIDAPLDAAQGWVASGVTAAANRGTSAATFLGGGVVRLTLGSSGNINSIGGPAVERAIPWATGRRWRIRVTPVAAVNTSGACFGAVYLRAAGTSNSANYYVTLMYASNGSAIAGAWSPGFGGLLGGLLTWGGGGTLEIHASAEGGLTFGVVRNDGLWTTLKTETLGFVPAFVGVCGACDGASVGRVDFRDLIVECLG